MVETYEILTNMVTGVGSILLLVVLPILLIILLVRVITKKPVKQVLQILKITAKVVIIWVILISFVLPMWQDGNVNIIEILNTICSVIVGVLFFIDLPISLIVLVVNTVKRKPVGKVPMKIWIYLFLFVFSLILAAFVFPAMGW